MATTMQYRWLLIPAGEIDEGIRHPASSSTCGSDDGVTHLRAGWQESRITHGLLIVASFVVTAAIVLEPFR